MVTLKRDAKTESKRRGGYATSMSSTMNNYDRFRLTRENDKEEEEITSKYYDDSPQYKEYVWNELNRTAPRRMLSPDEIKNGMKPEDLSYEQTSYTPTFSRQSYATSRSSARAMSRDEAQAQGLNFRAKLMIVAYVAVVVFFLTLIVINAGTLASLRSELNELNANPGVENGIIDSTINTPVVEEHLSFGMGSEGNLKNAVPAGDYTSMSVSAPTTYVASGNWFDGICDWLGGVVGG